MLSLLLFQFFFLGQVFLKIFLLKKQTELNVTFLKTFNALASLSRVTRTFFVMLQDLWATLYSKNALHDFNLSEIKFFKGNLMIKEKVRLTQSEL